MLAPMRSPILYIAGTLAAPFVVTLRCLRLFGPFLKPTNSASHPRELYAV